MSLHVEMSLGSGTWKSLGPITREGWNQLTSKLPRSASRDTVKHGMSLVVRLLENGKPIDSIHRGSA
jgi:hypothetical protein